MGEGQLRPWPGLPLLPGRSPGLAWPWLLLLGHCLGTGGREHIPGTGQHRRLEGFPSSFSFPPPVPPHTRPFIFPSRCRTKTPCSRALEWEPNGKHRAIGHRSCQAQAGQKIRTPPASSPGPSEGVSYSPSIYPGKGSLLRVPGNWSSR